MRLLWLKLMVLALVGVAPSLAFLPAFVVLRSRLQQQQIGLCSSSNDENEAERLKQQAEKLRNQIRDMEEQLGDERSKRRASAEVPEKTQVAVEEEEGPTLKNKRILVAGANGRLGSMVCRYLLRNHGHEIAELVASVHVVGENSPTARGYGRLSYEVGAEDGIGSIGPAWSSAKDRTASFRYNGEIMGDYNLNKLRIVECELLDPVECATVCENIDAVIWCATDFNGNKPRAVSGLNFAFLFRAVAAPDKGRVEIEGLQNMLGALKNAQQDRKWKQQQQPFGDKSRNNDSDTKNDPINFVLVSMVPEAYGNFETPFGEFNAIKRQGEEMLRTDFPSLSSTVLQMGQYEDNFVEEGQEIFMDESDPEFDGEKQVRLINRRDAARAAVEALTNKDLQGKTVQVYTAKR